MEEETVKFLIMVVGFAIIATLIPGQNLFGAVYHNLTEKQPIEQTIGGTATVSVAYEDINQELYKYNIQVNPILKITPAITDPIIEIVEYKGGFVDAGSISLENPNKVIELSSRTPPRGVSTVGTGAENYVDGQECFYQAGGADMVYLVNLLDVSEQSGKWSDFSILSGGRPTICKAKFEAMCKDDTKIFDYLQKCENGRDDTCYQERTLCGSTVGIELQDVDCQKGTAKIQVTRSEDMPTWEKTDVVRVGFFKGSKCTTGLSNIDIDGMKALCTSDLLGVTLMKTTDLATGPNPC